MITRWSRRWRWLRRLLSRSEWTRRFLGLPLAQYSGDTHGLILIQIDGLSRKEFQRALASGRMPTLKSLLKHDHYRIHSMYSGLPASTPSVQGELFYGERCAVPAFGFRNSKTHQSVRMFSQETAEEVQRRIEPEELEQRLLCGGSAYCNIYDGGADEAHFCASSLGWDTLLREIHPAKLLLVSVLYAWSVVRAIGLAVIEFFLSVFSFARKAITGRELWQELLMIPSRVLVTIIMRELVVIGASLDTARGLPIVHMNLLGYDEQAHRRGPGSRFAHWTLKGIDRAIGQIIRAGHRAHQRQYDVWVYSDHGQQATMPYQYVSGKTIQEACGQVIHSVCGDEQSAAGDANRRDTRAQWLFTGWLAGKLFGENASEAVDPDGDFQVSACGPVGLLYLNRATQPNDRQRIAESLVRQHQVPMAFVRAENGVTAYTPDGRFNLPDQADKVFGSDHPFLQEVAQDWILLCQHADAGDVVLSGWSVGRDSLSFTFENGAHAGPGTDETDAFALLPVDAPVDNSKPFLRPNDLRDGVMEFRGQNHGRNGEASGPGSLRVMTYNVHGCVGMDGMLSPTRIARVIAQSGVDVVALQELDVDRARSGMVNQAQEIARHLEMDHHFHASLTVADEKYGNAILSRYPMRLVDVGVLHQDNKKREPRSVIWTEIDVDGMKLQVLCTHLSLYPAERIRQIQSLHDDWIVPAASRGELILCGDMNTTAKSKGYRVLSDALVDTHLEAVGPTKSTWFSPLPLARIDHIFHSEGLNPKAAGVVRSRLAKVASDHVPLVVELEIPEGEATDQSASRLEAIES